MHNDELTKLVIEEVTQSRKDHTEALREIAQSLQALNETNVLHAERANALTGTVQASAEALRVMTAEIKTQRESAESDQKASRRFQQMMIMLLIAALIVVAGAQRVFEYSTFFKF